MDAGFGEKWFQEIDNNNWYWLSRIRQGKSLKLSKSDNWMPAKNIFPDIGIKAKSYNDASIIITHDRKCRIITKKSSSIKQRKKPLRTTCISRWAVKLLLAAIVQIIFWIIGIIGHSKDFQRKFQANTVRNEKVFSYFYLGQLIVEHDMLKDLNVKFNEIPSIVNQELARQW